MEVAGAAVGEVAEVLVADLAAAGLEDSAEAAAEEEGLAEVSESIRRKLELQDISEFQPLGQSFQAA